MSLAGTGRQPDTRPIPAHGAPCAQQSRGPGLALFDLQRKVPLEWPAPRLENGWAPFLLALRLPTSQPRKVRRSNRQPSANRASISHRYSSGNEAWL